VYRRSCTALLVFASLAVPAFARGPATPAEREKTVALVEVLETKPASPEAAEARTWLMAFLSEVPDLTAKYCASLVGSPAERQGLRKELVEQHLFSGAAHLIRNPGTHAGATDTLAAGLAGTVRAYQAWKAVDPAVAHPRLEQLATLHAEGQLETYTRAAGRMCR
jgi:hypothetical protein